jgi:hypothetical protein
LSQSHLHRIAMTHPHASLSRRTVLALAAAPLVTGCATRSGVVVQVPADFKLQRLRVRASFKPAKLMVTVSGPAGLVLRVEPNQTAEAERLTKEFADKLTADFAARFGDDARAAGLPLLEGDAAGPAPTLTLSVPLSTVNYQLPGAQHYRGNRPFVLFNVVASVVDASGREVWGYKGGALPTPETALPENRDRAGYRLLAHSLFQAMRLGGVLPQ